MLSLYCVLLFSILFRASCFWQAIPIDTRLTNPLGNATTFAEAVRANLTLPLPFIVQEQEQGNPSSQTQMQVLEFPSHIQPVDHCWCDIFSVRGLFEPTDVSTWERKTVERMQRKLMEQAKAANKKAMASAVAAQNEKIEGEGEAQNGTSSPDDVKAVEDRDPSQQGERGRQRLFYRLRNLVRPTRSAEPVKASPSPSPSLTEILSPSETASVSNSYSSQESAKPELTVRRKWFYDLRPYGLDVTIDFNWSRNPR